MEIILVILAVVIIAAIFGVLFFKKKQEALDETPITPVVNERASIATPSTADGLLSDDVVNPLDKAEHFISEQRYDNAIQELKRILMSNPQNQDAMLKLLQVYGITNNHKAFEQLHQKIHQIGNDEIIQKADFCRSLLEEDLETTSTLNTSAAPKKEAQDIQIDTLEFDVGQQPQAQTPQPTPIQTNDESLHQSFDESFDLNFDEPNDTTSQSSQSLEESRFDESFDLSFDDLEPASAVDNSQIATQDETAIDDAFDFNFDEPETLSQSESASTAQDDFSASLDDDFDLNLNEPSADTIDDVQLDDSLSTDEFDLSFDEIQANDTLTLGDDLNLDDSGLDDGLAADFDLSFDEPASDTSAGNISNDKSDTLSFDDNTSFDDMSFDETAVVDDLAIDTKTQEDTQVFDDLHGQFDEPQTHTLDNLSQDIVSDTQTFDDEFAFEIDSPQNDTQTIDQVDTQTVTDDFAFELGDSLTGETTADISTDRAIGDDLAFDNQDPHMTTEEFGFDFDDTQPPKLADTNNELQASVQEVTSPQINQQTISDEPTFDDNTPIAAVTPKSSPMDNFADDLSFAIGGDTVQVTLDLANRYLNLGEQDSAKRLLEEVLASGNNKQRETAQSLIARL